MKRLSRDAWLTLGLLVVLIVILIASTIYDTNRQKAYPRLASISDQPDGGRALRLWLEEMGHTVTSEVLPAFGLPPMIQIALLLEPALAIEENEWSTLDAFVEAGGTLLLAGENIATLRALQHYDFSLSYNVDDRLKLTPQSPLLQAPVLPSSIDVRPAAHLRTDRSDFVVHLAIQDQPVLVTFDQGEGRVILCACSFPFTNAGLKEAGNRELVLNLVNLGSPRPATIWVDDWHHGLRSAQASAAGPGDWLRLTPPGHALLYSAVVIFLALAFQGRLFGRPVPLHTQTYRRAPLEHVTALAQLSRRAGHRTWVLRQYYLGVKRHFARRYRINSSLDDDAYVKELARYRPGLDSNSLLYLLQRLRQPDVSEGEMLKLAAEAANWMEK